MTADAKKTTKTSPKPAEAEAPKVRNTSRARNLPAFKRIANHLIPYLDRELDRCEGIGAVIRARRQGNLMQLPDGSVTLTNDGRDSNRAALNRELTEWDKSTFNDADREAEIRRQIAEIDDLNKSDAIEAAENTRGVSSLRKLLERARPFIRDYGDTRVSQVAIPEGTGDGRIFDKINAEQEKIATEIESVELAPRTLAEMKERLKAALPEIFKKGGRTLNLDRIALPDVGLPKIEFTGESFRDPVTGGVIELPTAAEFVAAMFEKEFEAFAVKKLEKFAEHEGKGISSEERKSRLAALSEKRFGLHLKIVGEWEACREKRIPVVLPGDLSLFAFCGLKPRRARDFFVPTDRDSGRNMRDS